MNLQRAIILLVGMFLLPSFAHAQPELKVGQEVELYEDGSLAFCKVTEVHEGWIMCWPKHYAKNGWSVTLSRLQGYRILKPAPRPEFELPSEAWVGSVRPHPTENDQAIADELRWLRKEIEAMKK